MNTFFFVSFFVLFLFLCPQDPNIGAIVITGSEKAFAAGADIKEMKDKTHMEAHKMDMLATWQNVSKIRTPIIAAVNGYALGGGCELAMMADIIIAGEGAKFGQPEITIGTIPGCGGTQRLTRVVGKSKAMELILTGNMMDAVTAEKAGLVSKVVAGPELMGEAMKMASKIASFSKPVTLMAKEAVNVAYESNLDQGILFEKRLFHSTFGTVCISMAILSSSVPVLSFFFFLSCSSSRACNIYVYQIFPHLFV